MKRLVLSIGLCVILIVVLCLSIWGQVTKTVTGQIEPFVIDIAQAVPVQVSVPITGDNPVTMTLPLTVRVSLRVEVDTASKTVKVRTLPAPTPVVAIAIPVAKESDTLFSGVPFIANKRGQVVTLEGVAFEVRSIRLMPMDLAVKANKELANIVQTSNAASGAKVIGLVSIVISNTNTIKLTVHPTDGHVVVGAESVNRLDALEKDVGGDILPGVTKEGVIIFFLAETDWEDLSKGATFIYNAGRPFNGNLQQGDKEFEFALELNTQQ